MRVKKSVSNTTIIEKSSLLYWSIMSVIMLLLLISPFYKGLFNGYKSSFDASILTFQAFFFGICILFAIYLFSKNTFSLRTDAVHWVVWTIPIVYLLSSLISPASAYHSSQAVYIQITCALAFTMGLYLSKTTFSARILLASIIGSGSVIIIFGFMNWFGDASLWGLFTWNLSGTPQTTYHDAVFSGPDGLRLTSIFQYANSYAALLIAMIVSYLTIAAHLKRIRHVLIVSLFLLPAFISLMLTLSRAGLLIFPIIILVTLPFIKWTRQLMMIGYLVVTVAISLLVLEPITNLGTDLQQPFDASNALKGWLILIAASIGVALLNAAIHYLITKKAKTDIRTHVKRLPLNVVVPLLAVIMGGLLSVLLLSTNVITNLLPDNIKERVENINFKQNSVLERGTFYTDAMKLVKEYPIFGAGGGSWANLYEKYQNNPYISNQTHSYFMQVLVEAGFVGLIAMLAFLGAVYYYFIRSYYKKPENDRIYYLIFYVLATSILIHSILDFNMSYIYISFIVYLSLGGMMAIDTTKPFQWQDRQAVQKKKFIYPLFIMACSIILMFLAINNLSSNKSSQIIKDINTSVDKTIGKLKNPEYVDMQIQYLLSAYMQTNDTKLIDKGHALIQSFKQKEPYYKPFVYRELQLYLLQNDFVSAAKLLEAEIPNYQWDISLYSELAGVHFQAGFTQLLNGQGDQATQEWDKATALLQRVQDKAVYLETLSEHQIQGRAFGLTPDFALSLGKIAFLKADYSLAEQYLQMRVDPTYNDPKDVEAATYYIATLRKQQKDDLAIMEEMFTKIDENTQTRVNEQINTLLALPPVTT